FETYIAERVLQPLGMRASTFEQPPPRPRRAMVSQGYFRADGPPLSYFETVEPTPSGGLSTTGDDMGRFMLALLRPELMERMRGLGYERTDAAGHAFVGKHGLSNVVVSDLELLPEERFGLFVSYNTLTARDDASTALLRVTARRFFGDRTRQPHP